MIQKSQQDFSKILSNVGVRPSIQRVAIYEYLYTHPCHPDIEKIYSDLSPKYATLSKTTVYNTLKLFEEKNIVQSVKIEDDKVRFDANTTQHIHFKCEKCGNIYDIPQEQNSLPQLPNGYKISKIQTYIWGVCPHCAI